MEQTQKVRRKAVVAVSDCVACGCCEKVCPKQAVKVSHGVYAVVSPETCIGCGLCVKVCPASVIRLEVPA